MSSTMELYVGGFMVVLSVGLVLCFRNYRHRASNRRRFRMLQHIGLGVHQVAAVEGELRSRCLTCSVENLCERWLAGEVGGDNGFCPNAKTLDRAKTAYTPLPIRRNAASPPTK